LGNVIIPTDELHHFSEGFKPPTSYKYGGVFLGKSGANDGFVQPQAMFDWQRVCQKLRDWWVFQMPRMHRFKDNEHSRPCSNIGMG